MINLVDAVPVCCVSLLKCSHCETERGETGGN